MVCRCVSDVEAKYPPGHAKKGNGEAEEKVEVNGESRLITLSVITSMSQSKIQEPGFLRFYFVFDEQLDLFTLA
jgi:hypothetical protein